MGALGADISHCNCHVRFTPKSVSAARLRSNRRIGVGICIIIVVLLPGVDFVSMALQAIPVLVLFEGSIWAAAS